MPISKSSNSFKTGLNLSVDNINQPKDSYSYALNIVKEDPVNNPEIVTNERGFTQYFNLGYEYVLVGSCYLGEENYVLFIKNVLGASAFNRIILLQEGTPTTIYDNIGLNFQDTNPIKATYRFNFRNQRVVYFVDGLNKDRVINVDNTSIYVDNVSELSIDVEYLPAVLTSKTIQDDGGNLSTGTYEFFASYKTLDNATTDWFILTANPVYIIQANAQSVTTSGYVSIDGCDSGIPTNKSVLLNIQNLDPRFSILRIGVIKTIGNVPVASYVDNIYYSSTSMNYTYTGLDTEVVIPDISTLIVDTVKYYGSNTIGQMNNRLLRANMNSNKIDIGYQSYANNINVSYYIYEEDCGTMQDSTDYTVRSQWWQSAATAYTGVKSLMRDEVYSLGIAFGLINEGVESEVYHIPGRAINSIPAGFTYYNQYNDTATLPYSTTWDTSSVTENGVTAPLWKVSNTAAASNDGTVKLLGYWESTEMYPPNLNLPTTGSSTTGVNNTPIRHHKMPSSGLEPIFRTTETSGVITFIKRHLGLNFTNIVVPDTLKDNISYIRFYITPRTTEQNQSIIGKGIFTNCSLTKINIGNFSTVSTDLYVQPCTPFNDQNELFNGGCYTDGQDTGWTTNNYYHSFYSPDTTLRNPPITADKVVIENEMNGVAHYYNTQAGLINVDPYTAPSSTHGHTDSSTNGGYKRDLFYDDALNGQTFPTANTSSHAIYNITSGNFRSTYKAIAILNGINQVQNTASRRSLKQSVYVPFNANLSTGQLGGMDNPYVSPYGSSNVLLELNPLYSNLGYTATTDTSFEFTDNDNSHNLSDGAQASDVSGTYHQHTITSPLVVYRYGSIKRSNNSQYGTIEGLEYNPTDLVIPSPTFDSTNTLIGACQGLIGDSWIDMYSVKRTKYFQRQNYTFGGYPEIAIGISTFFTESNINHRLRYAEGTDFRTYYPKQILSSPIKTWLDVGYNSYIFFNDGYYKENIDFDLGPTKKNYGLTQLDAQTVGVTNYGTRILYSDQLLDESAEDSYRVFAANDYRDLPKSTGFITHLFKKGAELYAVTRDSLWRVFTSPETVKASGQDITIGTGDFFSLEPIEMLSIEGGHGGSSSKMSLAECSYGYFYVDKNKGKLILFRDRQSYYDNSQQVDTSLIGIFHFVRENFKLTNPSITDFDTPLQNSGYLSGYDSELKRILVTKVDYSLTAAQQAEYQGVFNPNTTYTAGNIYLKDGVYYTYSGTTSSYSTVITSTNLSDFVQGTLDTPTATISTAPLHGTASSSGGYITYTPNTGYTGSDVFYVGLNCGIIEVDVTVFATPSNNYTAYAQYGMTINSIIDNTTTGTPAGFNTITLTPPSSLSLAYTTITPGIVNVGLSGTPSIPGHVQLYLAIGGSTVSTANVTGGGTYHLTFPSTVTNPTTIQIGLQTY